MVAVALVMLGVAVAAHVAALPLELLPAAAIFGFAACMLFWASSRCSAS